MAGGTREEKLALAKEKLHRYQKSRRTEGLQSVVGSITVGNGAAVASMMSSTGSIHDFSSRASFKTGTMSKIGSSPERSQRNGSKSPERGIVRNGVLLSPPSKLSPIESVEGLEGVMDTLENLKIQSAEIIADVASNRSFSPTASHSTERGILKISRPPSPLHAQAMIRIEELQSSNLDLSEKIVMLEDAIRNLKEEKHKLLSKNEQLVGSIAGQLVGDTIETEENRYKIEILESELQKALNDRDQLHAELESLSQQLQSGVENASEIECLQNQIQQYQDMISALQASVADARQTILNMEEAKVLMEVADDQLTEKNVKENDKVAKLQARLEEHEKMEKSLRNQIATLVYQVDKAEEAEGHSQQEISRLKGIVKFQTQDLANLEERLTILETESSQEIAQLLEKIAQLEQDIVNANSQDGNDPVQARLIHYRGEAESLRKENQTLADRIVQLEQSENEQNTKDDDAHLIQDLRAMIKSQTEEIEYLKQDAHRVKQKDEFEIAQLKLRNEEQEILLEAMNNDDHSGTFGTSHHTSEISELRQKLLDLQVEHRQEVEMLNQELASLRLGGSINADSVLLEELQAINEAQVLELQAAQIDIENIRISHSEEIIALKEKLESYSSSADNEVVQELQRINEEQMFELETLRINMEDQKQSHKNEMEKFKKDSKHIEEFYEAEIELLNQKLKEGSAEVAQSDAFDRIQNENEMLMIQIEELKIKIEAQEEAHRLALESNSTTQLPDPIVTLEEYDALKSTFESQATEIKSLFNTLQEERDAHFTEVRKLELQLEQKSTLPIVTNEMIDELRAENESLLIKLAETENAPTGSSHLLESLQSENESNMLEISALNSTVEDQTNQISALNFTIEGQTNQINTISENFKKLEGEYNVLAAELEIARATIQNSKTDMNELNDLQAAYDSLNSEYLSQSKILRELKNDLEKERASHSDTTILLETLQNLTEQNQDLKALVSNETTAHNPDIDALVLELQEERERCIELEGVIESNAAQYEVMIEEHEKAIQSYEERISGQIPVIPLESESILKAELQDSEERVRELEGIIESNSSQYQLMSEEFENNIQWYNSEVERLGLELETLKPIEEQFKQYELSKNAEIENLNAKILNLTSEKAVLEERIEDLLREANNSSMQPLEPSEELNNLKNALFSIETNYAESGNRIIELESLIESNNAQFETTLESLAYEKDSKILELENQLMTSGGDNDRANELQAVLEQDQRTIEELNAQLFQSASEFQNQIDQQNAYIAQLQASGNQDDLIQSLQADLENARYSADSSFQKISELESEIEIVNRKLQEEIQLKENAIFELGGLKESHDNAQLNAGSNHESEYGLLKAELENAEDHISTLESVIAENTSKFEALLQEESLEKNRLLSEIDDLRVSLEESQAKAVAVLAESENVQEQLELKSSELQETLGLYNDQNELHQEELKAKRTEYEKILLDCETAQVTINDLTSQLESSQGVVSQWEEYCNKTLADQEAYYQNQIEELKSSTGGEDTSVTMDNLKAEISDLQSSYSKLSQEYDVKCSKLDETAVELENAKSELDSKSIMLDGIDITINSIYGLFNSISENESSAPDKLNSIFSLISEKLSMLEEMGVSITELQAKLGHIHQQNEQHVISLQEKIDSLSQGIEQERFDMSTQIQNLELQLQEKNTLLSDLQTNDAGLQTSPTLSPGEVDNLKAELDSVYAAKELLSSECTGLQTRLEEYDGKFEESQIKLDEANQIIQDWQQYVSGIEFEKEALNTQLQTVTEQLQEYTNKISATEEVVNSDLEAIKAENENLSSQILSLESELEHLKTQADNAVLLQEKFDNLSAQLSEKDSELNRLGELVHQLEESLQVEKSTLQQELDQSVAALSDLSKQLDDVQSQLENEKSQSAEKLGEYESYITVLDQEKISLMQQIESLEYNNSQNDAQNNDYFASLQNDIATLTEQFNVKSQEESTLRAQLDEAIDVSNSKDATINDLYGQLTERHQSTESTIQQLKDEFDELAILFQNATNEANELKDRFLNNPLSSSLSESLNVTERTALNNLISALEGEKAALLVDIKTMRSKESSMSTLKEEIAALETKLQLAERTTNELRMANQDLTIQITRNDSQSRMFDDQIQQLHSQLRESDRIIQKAQIDLQKAYQELQVSDERLRNAEMDRDHYLTERDRIREQADMDLSAEQQRSRDILDFRIQELRASFDITLDDLQRKQSHLEQLLDDAERALIEERAIHHQREQELVQDIRFFRDNGSNRYDIPPSPSMQNFAHDRIHLEQRISDLLSENRRLQRALGVQENEFIKERYSLFGEISALKQDLDQLERTGKESDTNRIIKKLQEQKNDLEFQLSQKDERLSRMQELVKNDHPQALDQMSTLEKQKEAIEKILGARELELRNAEMKINSLLHERNLLAENSSIAANENERNRRLAFKVQELTLTNKQLKAQISIFTQGGGAMTGQESMRIELSNAQTLNSEIVLLLGELFARTLGFQEFAPSLKQSFTISRIKSQCVALAQEFIILKHFAARESHWKRELKYQKRYLTLKLEDLERSSLATIEILKRKGIRFSKEISSRSGPRNRWKLAINMVLAICRMQALVRVYKDVAKQTTLLFAEDELFASYPNSHMYPLQYQQPLKA